MSGNCYKLMKTTRNHKNPAVFKGNIENYRKSKKSMKPIKSDKNQVSILKFIFTKL